MKKALIGHTGFVGSTLLKQTTFTSLYRSTNIREIEGQTFDTIVCAGASAKKWIANKNPKEDSENIESLIARLKTVRCKTFILISTVDVYKDVLEVDETVVVNEDGLQAYGLNRRRLEKFVESHFPECLIVRLPGLVGPGLLKNVIYDFLNNNNLDAIDSRGVFQFYPMVNLWFDIKTCLVAGLKLIHLTAEPISVRDASMSGFGKSFDHVLSRSPAVYDFRTQYANLFGVSGHYQYSRSDTIQAIRAYAQSEPVTAKSKMGEIK